MNTKEYSYKSIPECENKCNEMDNCLGFNFWVNRSECYLKNILKDECPIIYDPNGVAYLKFALGEVLIFKVHGSNILYSSMEYSKVLSQNHNRFAKSPGIYKIC